jgi:hypothetical protein
VKCGTYFLAGVLAVVGCQQTTTTPPAARAEPDPPLAPFVGKPAPAVTWDLWGDWTLTRTARADGKAGAPGRFDESWHLRRREDKSKPVWTDPNRGETFTLVPGNGKGDRLRWRRYLGRVYDFSINRQSYGLLIMTDQDGENYMAVRSEGGE